MDEPLDWTPPQWRVKAWAEWNAVKVIMERGWLMTCAVVLFGLGVLFGVALVIERYDPSVRP